jgi:Protein of unknown function (DUF3137)
VTHPLAVAPALAAPVLGGLVVAALLARLVTIVAQHSRRSRALRRLAAEHGWTLARGKPPTQRWDWDPFVARNDGTASDVLTGELDGHRFAEFTYTYANRVGGSRPSIVGVSAVRLPAALPRLQVSPEGIAPGPGWLDVDLESEEFNRRYRVQAKDRRYAVDVLTPRVMRTLLEAEPFTLRIDGADLVAFGPPASTPQRVLERLRTLVAIAELIPAFVFEDRGRPAR